MNFVSRLTALLKRSFQRLLRDNKGLVAGTIIVGFAGLLILILVIAPAYKSPKSRMYTSSLGYGAMKRKMGLGFDVKAAKVKQEQITIPYLGEGIVSGEPIRVPIIPLAMITKVYVKEGDKVKKGDLLMELDDRKAQRNLEAAELALNTVEAEMRRVEVGSAYVLAQERPEADKIERDAAEKEYAAVKQQLESIKKLYERGIISSVKLTEVQRELVDAEKRLLTAKFNQGMSEKGVGESLLIAKNAVQDAQQNVTYRRSELDDFKIFAPHDGIISAVLVRQGEFNQDIGKPAFLLTSGMWFEAYFDQAILGRVRPGLIGDVYLEAFPGHNWRTEATHVIPQITFATGGPEINRPLRPRGTGAPEWAATFSVRFSFNEIDPKLTLGMTGNIRLKVESDSIIVHRNALLSIAAGRAIVIVPGDEPDTWRRVPVETGYIGHMWAEVKRGLKPDDLILIDGHRILREGDKVSVEEVIW
ncbi:MAG: biotin/lipoyl-binding protein [Verrucomicrobiota bacterium]